MKKFLTLLGVLISYYVSAQATSNVVYTPATASISNPDRGFYRHTETHSGSYSALNQSTLTNYRVNNNYTLILRVFYLEDFVDAPISASYLSSMQADFNKIRNAGLKCIVRFAYSDDNDNGAPQDASKARILEHINQLKPMLISNADIITVMQAGFIGAWGEWYYTDHFGMEPNAADYANRKQVVDAILNALPTSRMVQLRTPSLKQNTYNTPAALSANQAFNGTNVARLGHHNDCFLASSDDYGTYNNVSTEYPYLEQETKYLPMGGETCKVNEPRSGCSTAVQEMSKFHWSYLNLDYHPGVIDGFESGSCYPEIENRLGYRFELTNGTFPQVAAAGNIMPVTLKLKNNGFATPYNARTIYMVLRNTANNQEYSIQMNANPRLWTSGGQQLTVAENITIPASVPSGNYKLFLWLPDAAQTLTARPEYAIRMANNGLWEGTTGYNDLQHTVNVTSALGVVDNDRLDLKLYPVPTNNELVIEYDGISEFNLAVFNSIGQKIALNYTVDSNKMTVNTQSLSNGVYFIQLENGQRKETRKIIVNH